jgi:hypothetical protein
MRLRTSAAPAVALVAVLPLLAGCGGDDEPEAPAGYAELGAVAEVPVYAKVSEDGFTVDVRLVDDELGCEGSAPLVEGLILTEVCNTQTPTTYVYAAALPRNAQTPKLCDARSGEPAAGTRLAGAEEWTIDFVVAVGREATFVMPCPGENLLREKK